MSTRSITVEIAGLSLPVRTTATDAEIQRVVDVIQERFEAIQAGAPTQPVHRHLALVAMSLAQELLNARDEQAHSREESQALAHALLATLDEHEDP